MNRDALIHELAQAGDGRKAMVVDLGGSVVDVAGVRFDHEGNCVVLALDEDDLEGALLELRQRQFAR